ncbi:DUF2497 domain-containing protein [Magnetospirillum sp. UT-4]|uniref:DUF2497 domain-containing protein n=1 Tax=Magnetospirillum sp. UT-4 TaxID=2681467 RepID=UPI00137F812B|nr:DUF2497 domain-containing protein [Magnetospirillum sp. UT-4]CAA7618072.1 conserved hypothetical protein [Magnetospirillum sp. UT-4]
MSDDKAQQEPSMEDILASIRRILSEDEAEEKSADPVVEPAPEPEPVPVFEPEPEPEPLPQDDIDAMFADAAPEPVPEPVFEPEPEPEPVFEPEPEPEPFVMPEPEDDVLELTEDMVLDEDEPAFDINAFKPDLGEYEPEPVMPAPRRPAPRRVDEDALISDNAAHRSTSLLSDLAREIVRQRSIGLGNGGITLEAMVRELLKPILKEWLDENLPYMIERIVKKEIEKMVNRAENL